jgi:CheY-like chemotaxis protein
LSTASPPPLPLDRLTILVVDDHRDTVEMMEEYLAACGATVVGAGGAKAALAIAETHVLDAVVVDLRMPGEDGWWLFRELRASRTASANAPVFAVSGERHDRSDPASGFAGYFLKPVDLDAVVSTLSRLPRLAR